MLMRRSAGPAFAANTAIRSGMAAGFPMFATQLFHRVGIGWGTAYWVSLLSYLHQYHSSFITMANVSEQGASLCQIQGPGKLGISERQCP